MRLRVCDEPAVRLVACATVETLEKADDAVEELLDDWRPEDIALLAAGSRHSEQEGRHARGTGSLCGVVLGRGLLPGIKWTRDVAVVLPVNQPEQRETVTGSGLRRVEPGGK